MNMIRTNNHSSVSKVAEIEELLIEILLRVPPKPLTKFKCVSKQWLSLISDSKFCHSYARISPKFSLLVDDDMFCSKFQVIPLNPPTRIVNNIVVRDFLKIYGHAKIVQSCNGLLLCQSSFLSNPHTDDFTFDGHLRCVAYIVCNPTTGQLRRIVCPSSLSPPSSPNPNLKYSDALFSVCLGFNPRISNHYKVIFIFDWDWDLCVKKHPTHKPFEIFIYSSETQSWSWHRIEAVDYGTKLMRNNNNPFCFNDAIHWVRYRSLDHTGIVLRFDSDTIVFKTINVPYFNFLGFGEYRENLQMITREGDYSSLKFNIWEVASDYSKVSIRYSIDLESVKRVHPDWNFSPSSIFSIICGEDIKDTTFVISVENMAVSYNHSDGTFEMICDVEQRPQDLNFNSLVPCVSSYPYHDYAYRDPVASYYRAFQFFESYYCV
ncbi:putative F-box protein At3g16210 [Mercurialis annua]|uniref:putative F-box protein At3g16210 n=1 Tax=Mercurialis annua TaxID=3986 RepID=UPI00215F367F|nr:putative F-box protein At3g16210 [Mercurialis annua]